MKKDTFDNLKTYENVLALTKQEENGIITKITDEIIGKIGEI